ncbi:hypothetical protein ACHOLT_11710 [Desulfitobacterium sp. Sab5]|uniref:hypothetical protein n=1 Tax=Desulfitobacterium nosdiversum TaxID=3375356 RepID=UPI003CE73EDD
MDKNKDDNSPQEEGTDMDTTLKRPCTPSASLAQSLKEMKQMREGKLPKKSWWDYIKEQKDKD